MDLREKTHSIRKSGHDSLGAILDYQSDSSTSMANDKCKSSANGSIGDASIAAGQEMFQDLVNVCQVESSNQQDRHSKATSDNDEIQRGMDLIQISSKGGKEVYICTFEKCHLEFDSKKLAKAHSYVHSSLKMTFKKVHRAGILLYKCSACSSTFDQKSFFHNHWLMKHLGFTANKLDNLGFTANKLDNLGFTATKLDNLEKISVPDAPWHAQKAKPAISSYYKKVYLDDAVLLLCEFSDCQGKNKTFKTAKEALVHFKSHHEDSFVIRQITRVFLNDNEAFQCQDCGKCKEI
jgi:hypothetical protein